MDFPTVQECLVALLISPNTSDRRYWPPLVTKGSDEFVSMVLTCSDVTSTIGEADAFFRWIGAHLGTGDAAMVREPERVTTANVMRGTGVGVSVK